MLRRLSDTQPACARSAALGLLALGAACFYLSLPPTAFVAASARSRTARAGLNPFTSFFFSDSGFAMKTTFSHWLTAAALGVFSAPLFAQSAVELTAPWARATVQGQQAGGAFVTLQSGRDDALLAASSPSSASMEIHEMRLEDNIMRMRQISRLALPADQPIELKPGGYHLMFQGLRQPLQAGTEVEVTLTFEKAGRQTLRFPVRPLTAGQHDQHQHGGHQHGAGHTPPSGHHH